MGGIADDSPGFEEFLLSGRRFVEYEREFTQLGRSRVGRGACREISVGDFFRCLFESVDRPRDQTCQNQSNQGDHRSYRRSQGSEPSHTDRTRWSRVELG